MLFGHKNIFNSIINLGGGGDTHTFPEVITANILSHSSLFNTAPPKHTLMLITRKPCIIYSTLECGKWLSLGESKYYLLEPITHNVKILSLSAFQNTYQTYYFINFMVQM